jgi:hypothetical protein
MAGCTSKKFAKGGAVRKPLKMANGGLVPSAPATQSAMSSGAGMPMTQIGDAAAAQKAMAAFRAANPSAGSGGQSVQPASQSMTASGGRPFGQPGAAIQPAAQSSMTTPNVARMPPMDQSRPTAPSRPGPATQSAMSSMSGKPMTQTGDAASAQRAMTVFKAANPNASSGKQSVKAAPSRAPIRARPFKDGGMVSAKKSSGSSVRPRGSSGRGVKSCKVC